MLTAMSKCFAAIALVAVFAGCNGRILNNVSAREYGVYAEWMKAHFLKDAPSNQYITSRTFITLERMHLSDFTSFGMIGAQFHAPLPTSYPLNGWNRETGRAGYQEACRIVLSFLDGKLRADSNALGEMDRLAKQNEEISVKHLVAAPPPPSPLEAAALANANGLDALKRAFIVNCAEENLTACRDAIRFNTWGYHLLGQQRPKDALAVFQLNAWAHPPSANAQDSLADGSVSVNDKERARAEVQRAIALAPADQTLDPNSKSSFLSEEKAKLESIQ